MVISGHQLYHILNNNMFWT